ncbi:hypothetical protein [Microcoleus sp. herbarium12]|uniref:hypothetical protein n=1 Tax=Microcoleus sp. herbarium12 TaxID=3055437 RepID=UPI002FCFFBF5
MLKRQKGYSIATKSVKAKLIRSKFDMQETKDAYNEVVHFYFLLITENPQGVTIPVQSNGGWRFYELLTAGHQFVSGFPSPLKRAAIRQAIGAYESWNSTYQKWLNRSKRRSHHKPPVHPRAFRFNPQYDSGMWKEDDGFSIVLKMRVGDSWKWVKHQYQCPTVPTEWVKGSPRIQVQNGSLSIVFPLEKYVTATGGIKGIMSKNAFRTCGIDMDLDKYIVIATVLETNDRGETTEIARHFINQSRHVARRKRDLGQVAIKMGQTKIVSRGFAKSKWDSITAREIDFSRTVSRELVEFAKHWKVDVISFEHLGNLRPKKGKFSLASNQKRAYWLKGKVFEQVKRIAYQDYAILTTRVCPKDTSRITPWNQALWRGAKFPDSLLEFDSYQPGAALVATPDGYKAHSGLNAARNVGLKAIKRNLPEAELNLKSLE